MDVETAKTTVEPPLTLAGFCQAVIAKYSSQWPPDERVIAQEFAGFFRVPTLFGFEGLTRFAARLGITLSEEKLPTPLRGHNHQYEGKREIRVGIPENPMAEALGIRTHTFFHELREQIEYEFRRLGHPVATRSNQEERAEEFASFVRAAALSQVLAPAFDKALEIESKFWRCAAVAGTFLLITVVIFSCMLLPRIEDRLPKWSR